MSLNLIIKGVLISLLLNSLTSLKRSTFFLDFLFGLIDILPSELIEKYFSPHLSMPYVEILSSIVQFLFNFFVSKSVNFSFVIYISF